ncbi:hypothetical protein LINPERPRIM_LOCUS33478 [Linum perenne]
MRSCRPVIERIRQIGSSTARAAA